MSVNLMYVCGSQALRGNMTLKGVGDASDLEKVSVDKVKACRPRGGRSSVAVCQD